MSKKPVQHGFMDEEEKDFIESFESALEAKEVALSAPKERARLKKEWKDLADHTAQRKAITLRLQQRDIERLKVIARQRGLPYQTLLSSVLHQFANGDLKEVRD